MGHNVKAGNDQITAIYLLPDGENTKARSPEESHFAKTETIVAPRIEGVTGEAGYAGVQQYLLALRTFLFVNYNH